MDIELILQSFHPRVFAQCVYGVTGAAHGIGEATVRGLCALGATVIAIDIDEKNLRRVQGELGEDAMQCVVGDVSDPDTLDQALQRIDAHGGRLDGWVNNAMINPYAALADQTEDQFVRAFEINMLAAWRICKSVVPIIEKHSQGGSIVNVSSIMATLTSTSYAAYCATKAGLEGLTRALAVELAPRRIRVNAIAPGMVMTWHGFNHLSGVDAAKWSRRDQLKGDILTELANALQPWPSPGMPQHLAAGILFLLSPASQYMTGSLLGMDGGAGAWLVPAQDHRRVAVVQRVAALNQELESLSREHADEYKSSED